MSLRNTLDFLERRAGMTRLDAYGLASVAVSFRITQVVDINKGVHAMIPKEIFAPELRSRITVAGAAPPPPAPPAAPGAAPAQIPRSG